MRTFLCRAAFLTAVVLLTVAVPALSESLEERIAELSPAMRFEIGSLQYVLRPSEMEELLAFRTDYMREQWIEDYWRSRDPNYTTDDNEIRDEHNRRVLFAQTEFPMSRWPGWDQRGEIYIRYGPPSGRTKVPGTSTAAGIERAMEFWYYPQYDLLVKFEDARGSGEYTYFLGRVEGPGGMRMRKIGDDISAQVNVADNELILPPEIAQAAARDRLEKMIFRLADVREATPSSYPFEFADRQIPLVYETKEFRGGETNSRLDVNVEFLADFTAAPGVVDSREYSSTAVVRDTDHNEIARRSQTLRVPVAGGEVDSSRLMPVQLAFSLKPGFYHVAVTVEEPRLRRFSSYKADVTCHDFHNKLSMSDIVFASRIAPVSTVSPFNRGAIDVVPHPSRTYRRPMEIPVYFEVYNLTPDANGMGSYEIEYRIISQTPRERSFWQRLRRKKAMIDVASGFETTVLGEQDPVNVTFSSDNLWVGDFTFRVTVTDLRTRTETSRDLVFHIVE